MSAIEAKHAATAESLPPLLLQQVLDSLSVHLAILDERGVIVAVNARWRDFGSANGGAAGSTGVGCDYFAVIDRAAADGVAGAAEVAAGIRAVMNGKDREFYGEYDCNAPGEERAFAVRVSRCSSDHGAFVLVAHEDITQRRQAYEKLRHAAFHDELTDLPNRKSLLEQLQRCVARTQRRPDFRFAILFLDVDRFKVINDSMGHARGDELLTRMADRLRCAVRDTDVIARCETMIARLGGDEFTVLLEDVTNREDAEKIATRIHRAMGEPFQIGGQELFVTVSIGITLYQPDDHRHAPEDFLRDADIAMYQAKSSGHGRHQVFETPMREDAVQRLELERDLRRALQAGQMLLHYQPVVSLQHRRVTGFEALIRWKHPEKGMISPAQFIPLAEEIGMIIPIGRWVLATACRQLGIWQRRFDPTLSMAVNVSSQQLTQGGLVEAVDRVMQAGQLDPRTLKLEITESALLTPSKQTTDDLHKLHARKIQLSLDDFGTGFSSLSHLHRLPIDQLKIDRSFVNRIHENERDEQLVSGICTLALRLGLDVVAEGVETSRQAQMLRRMGCKFGQGYYFAKPLPVDEADKLLDHQTTAASAAHPAAFADPGPT